MKEGRSAARWLVDPFGDGGPALVGCPRIQSSRAIVDASIEADRDASLGPDQVDLGRVGVVIGFSKGDVRGLADSRLHPGRHRRPWSNWPGGPAGELAELRDYRGPSLAPIAACATGVVSILRAGRPDPPRDLRRRPRRRRRYAARTVLPRRLPQDPRPRRRRRRTDRCRPPLESRSLRLRRRRRGGDPRPRRRRARPIAGDSPLRRGRPAARWARDAYHITDLNPDPTNLADLIGRALENADSSTSDVDHVNVHGTGTRVGDPLECRAIRRAFGNICGFALMYSKLSLRSATSSAPRARRRRRSRACRSGTGSWPPTLNLTDPDPACDHDGTPIVGRKREIRAALKLSIGFGRAPRRGRFPGGRTAPGEGRAMADPLAWLVEENSERKRLGLFRKLRPLGPSTPGRVECEGRIVVDFASNDYLGLAGDPRVVEAAKEAADRFGWGAEGVAPRVGIGRRSTRDSPPTSPISRGTEAALLFPTGFAANLGADRRPRRPGGCGLCRSLESRLPDRRRKTLRGEPSRLSSRRRRPTFVDLEARTRPISSHRDRHRRRFQHGRRPRPSRRTRRPGRSIRRDPDGRRGPRLGRLRAGWPGRGRRNAGWRSGSTFRVGTLSKAFGSIGGFVAGSATAGRSPGQPCPHRDLLHQPAARRGRRREGGAEDLASRDLEADRRAIAGRSPPPPAPRRRLRGRRLGRADRADLAGRSRPRRRAGRSAPRSRFSCRVDPPSHGSEGDFAASDRRLGGAFGGGRRRARRGNHIRSIIFNPVSCR